MYKIAVFVLLFGMTMWFGNYLNIRRKLPGMKKINVLSTILTFGYAFTISFIFLAFSNRSDAKLYIYVTIK